MTLETRERPLSETLPFKKSDTGRVDIDQDNVLRRIVMLVKITLETTTTAGTGAIEDDILNAIKKIRLVLSEDENKFNVDAFKWLVVESMEKGTVVKRDSLSIPTSGTKTDHFILLNADFAIARQNLSDLRALLDAPNESSLKLEIDWGSIADVLVTPNDTLINTTDSKVFINLVEVFDTEIADPRVMQASLADGGLIKKTGFTDIREGISNFDVEQDHNSFDDDIQEEQINPTPSNIWTHLLVTKEDVGSVTGTPVRANDIITQFKVENVKGAGEKILQSKYDLAHFANKAEYGQESIFTGALYLDWVDQRRGGLVNVVADALKWRFLTNAPKSSEKDRIGVFTRYVTSKR